MALQEANDPHVLKHYEGLIFKTAQLYAPYVEDDFEDIQQIFRIKAWRALLAFDSSRDDALSRDRYVFSCIKNQAKDLVKKRRRGELSIDDITSHETSTGELDTRDSFDERYLSTTEEQVYGLVEEDPVLIPSTLSVLERQVICLLYRDYKQAEVARELGIHKREIERTMRSIRLKMDDWRPAGEPDDEDAPVPEPVAA